ncbi:MAG: hypothetical protein ACOYLR_00910 [Chlorobium sp.]
MNNHREQLAVRWRYHAGHGALVWQMMFTETGDLIGQKRFTATRKALFFGIETSTGHLFRNNYLLMDHLHPLPAGEGWFTGIETVRGALVYCYACQPYSPEHQGVWALDVRAGEVVWSRSDISFIANLGDEFLVCRTSLFNGFPEREFLLIDPMSGTVVSNAALESHQVHAIRENVLPEEERQQIILPKFVLEGMPEEQLALQRVGVADTSRCECIVHCSVTVAALHELSISTGVWRSTLAVWRMDGLVYEECMEDVADKPCLNNFLIQGDHLYYLKGKEELVCVVLS